jgi:CubicO group peptidase (beta-lactamase class C family)
MGKVALTQAYGQRDVEANLPVTPATQFVICSVTKSFTSTAVALLHHEGRLDWAKPVRDYIPEFRLSEALRPAQSIPRSETSRNAAASG